MRDAVKFGSAVVGRLLVVVAAAGWGIGWAVLINEQSHCSSGYTQ